MQPIKTAALDGQQTTSISKSFRRILHTAQFGIAIVHNSPTIIAQRTGHGKVGVGSVNDLNVWYVASCSTMPRESGSWSAWERELSLHEYAVYCTVMKKKSPISLRVVREYIQRNRERVCSEPADLKCTQDGVARYKDAIHLWMFSNRITVCADC